MFCCDGAEDECVIEIRQQYRQAKNKKQFVNETFASVLQSNAPIEQAEYLLSLRANPNQTFPSTLKPLMIASSPEKVLLLIRHGADLHATDTTIKMQPIFHWIRRDKSEILHCICPQFPDLLTATEGSSLDNPLHFAAQIGSKSCVEELLNLGMDINCQNKSNQTPLILATLYFQTEIIDLLLEKGANPAYQDSDGNTFLHFLVQKAMEKKFDESEKWAEDPEIKEPIMRVFKKEYIQYLTIKNKKSESVIDLIRSLCIYPLIEFLLKNGVAIEKDVYLWKFFSYRPLLNIDQMQYFFENAKIDLPFRIEDNGDRCDVLIYLISSKAEIRSDMERELYFKLILHYYNKYFTTHTSNHMVIYNDKPLLLYMIDQKKFELLKESIQKYPRVLLFGIGGKFINKEYKVMKDITILEALLRYQMSLSQKKEIFDLIVESPYFKNTFNTDHSLIHTCSGPEQHVPSLIFAASQDAYFTTRLLELGCKLEYNLPFKFPMETPILRAAYENNVSVLDVLYKICHADFNDQTNCLKTTPLIIAASNGYIETAKYLLSKNVNVNLLMTNTPALGYAVHSKHPEMVDLLLDAHSDPYLGKPCAIKFSTAYLYANIFKKHGYEVDAQQSSSPAYNSQKKNSTSREVCAFRGCNKTALSGYSYCSQHKCQKSRCDEPKYQRHPYCMDHCCLYDAKCSNPRSTTKKGCQYCQNHVCTVPKCTNPKIVGDSKCRIHSKYGR